MDAKIPQSIIIVGGGCFGISTALELSRRPSYDATNITLIDTYELPNTNNSSWDINRIVRADYTDPLYASLAGEAMTLWRTTAWGASGRYTESGLLLLGDADATYIADSLALARERGEANQVEEFSGPDEIGQACQTGGSSGTWGYLNRKAGWVDAEKCMIFAYEELKRMGRVSVVTGKVTRLTTCKGEYKSPAMVTGVALADERLLSADLTIVAAGSLSPTLLDMRGIVAASAEVLTYLELTEHQVKRLRGMPAIINLSKGWFIVPPNGRVLKVARHGLGFLNTGPMQHPMIPGVSQISAPVLNDQAKERITKEGLNACRQALQEIIPWLKDDEMGHTRICWYTDTPSGDFIIDYHPQYDGLFIATGGSGHGFKFLPLIGRCVVDRLEGTISQSYQNLWSWPTEKLASEDEVRQRAYAARGGVLDLHCN